MVEQKNKQFTRSLYYPALYGGVALALGGLESVSAEYLQMSGEKVKAGVIFLAGLYLSLYFLFVLIQKRHPRKSVFIFLIIMVLKLIFISGFLFLFLNPFHSENKREILLFLMNYFVLLVVDLAVKIRLMK